MTGQVGGSLGPCRLIIAYNFFITSQEPLFDSLRIDLWGALYDWVQSDFARSEVAMLRANLEICESWRKVAFSAPVGIWSHLSLGVVVLPDSICVDGVHHFVKSRQL